MKATSNYTFYVLFFLVPIVFSSRNETESVKLKSDHHYSNLWFFQRMIGLIGIFLNILGKFTIRILQKNEQFALSSTLFLVGFHKTILKSICSSPYQMLEGTDILVRLELVQKVVHKTPLKITLYILALSMTILKISPQNI